MFKQKIKFPVGEPYSMMLRAKQLKKRKRSISHRDVPIETGALAADKKSESFIPIDLAIATPIVASFFGVVSASLNLEKMINDLPIDFVMGPHMEMMTGIHLQRLV